MIDIDEIIIPRAQKKVSPFAPPPRQNVLSTSHFQKIFLKQPELAT